MATSSFYNQPPFRSGSAWLPPLGPHEWPIRPSMLKNTAHFGCVGMLELGNSTDGPPGTFQRRLCKGKAAVHQRYSVNTKYTLDWRRLLVVPWGRFQFLYWEDQINNTNSSVNSRTSHVCSHTEGLSKGFVLVVYVLSAPFINRLPTTSGE